jgi:hypothetical protein
MASGSARPGCPRGVSHHTLCCAQPTAPPSPTSCLGAGLDHLEWSGAGTPPLLSDRPSTAGGPIACSSQVSDPPGPRALAMSREGRPGRPEQGRAGRTIGGRQTSEPWVAGVPRARPTSTGPVLAPSAAQAAARRVIGRPTAIPRDLVPIASVLCTRYYLRA